MPQAEMFDSVMPVALAATSFMHRKMTVNPLSIRVRKWSTIDVYVSYLLCWWREQGELVYVNMSTIEWLLT